MNSTLSTITTKIQAAINAGIVPLLQHIESETCTRNRDVTHACKWCEHDNYESTSTCSIWRKHSRMTLRHFFLLIHSLLLSNSLYLLLIITEFLVGVSRTYKTKDLHSYTIRTYHHIMITELESCTHNNYLEIYHIPQKNKKGGA